MYTKLSKRGSGWATLLLTLAFVLAACGNVDANSTAATGLILPSPTATNPPAAATTAAPASTTAAAGATTAAAGGATTAASGGTATGGDAAAGAQLFNAVQPACSACHLQGGKVKGVGPALINSKRDDAYILNQLKVGKGAMPAYPALSDAERNSLLAYIRSIK